MADDGPGRAVDALKQISDSYCAGGAREFYAGRHFRDASDRAGAAVRAVRPLDPLVADVIERQNAALAPCPQRERNLALLRRGAAAVVTGQQVGLFLGPLFNLYKAASAIRVARALADASGVPVVPVFWLQCEDHDLPEIACCRVPCANGETLCLELPAAAEQRISLAHLRLPAQVDELTRRLGAEIESLPHAAVHLRSLARHYRAGTGWADAFAGMLAQLFAGHGLIILNPRCPELAASAARVHRVAVERAGPIAAMLRCRSDELTAAGFTVAVHVRSGAPLSFYHPAGADGPRFRLEPTTGGWHEIGGGGMHTTSELLRALDDAPLSFSTSVLLRPILQDALLPTAAYVGGAGEIAYFAQLAPLYEIFGLSMPLIVPRAALRLVEGKTQRLLARLGAQSDCATRPVDEIAAGAVPPVATAAERLRLRLNAAFDEELQRNRGEIESAGPGMVKAIAKARASVEHAVELLAVRYAKARLQEERDVLEAARALQRLLQPDGMPQERFYGLPYFAARYGERSMIEQVLAAVEPFDAAMRDLHLTETAA